MFKLTINNSNEISIAGNLMGKNYVYVYYLYKVFDALPWHRSDISGAAPVILIVIIPI